MWDALIDKTADIERQTVTQDASGGSVRTFSTVLSACPVSIQALKSFTINDYARRDINVSHAVYTTTDLDTALTGGLQPGDRFSDAAGIKYVVVGLKKDQNSVLDTEPLYKAICQERRT